MDYSTESSKRIKKIIKDIAVELGDEFGKNFERQAFFGKAWDKRRDGSGDKLLYRTGKLRRSIRKEISDTGIRFTSSEPYAAIHNEGGIIVVTKKMKRFFWAKYYEVAGKVKTTSKGAVSPAKSNQRVSAAATAWKYMALMKEGSKIRIPQRQLIGDAPEVRAAIERVFEDNFKSIEPMIKNILKPKR